MKYFCLSEKSRSFVKVGPFLLLNCNCNTPQFVSVLIRIIHLYGYYTEQIPGRYSLATSESKKGKEPRNQVPRKVWKSEEGFGQIPRLNVAIWHFKVPFTI